MKKLAFIILLTMLAGYAQAKKGKICGRVVWIEGNQMPGPDKVKSPNQGVFRELYVYELTLMDQVKEVNGFYQSIETRLIRKIKTSKNGKFKSKIPVGIYSVFVREPEGLWANLFDGQGQINPVTVKKGTCEPILIQINYQAAY